MIHRRQKKRSRGNERNRRRRKETKRPENGKSQRKTRNANRWVIAALAQLNDSCECCAMFHRRQRSERQRKRKRKNERQPRQRRERQRKQNAKGWRNPESNRCKSLLADCVLWNCAYNTHAHRQLQPDLLLHPDPWSTGGREANGRGSGQEKTRSSRGAEYSGRGRETQRDGGLQRATGVNHSLLFVFCGIVSTTHMHIGSCSRTSSCTLLLGQQEGENRTAEEADKKKREAAEAEKRAAEEAERKGMEESREQQV